MIELLDINLKFETKQIFENLNLKIEKGQKLALKGKSGAGKTTFLRMILGFVRPDKGKIFIENKELNAKNLKYIRSLTAWLPQNFDIYFDDTQQMFDFVFTLNANKKNKPQKSDIQKIFDIFDLDTDLLKKNISELSGGQKQRILLASLMLTNKKIILLDEPTSALDEKTAQRVANFLLNHKSLIIFATHDNYILQNSQILFDLDNKKILYR